MSTVKCHYCGAEVPLERARPRGGIFSGFMCGDCFGRRSVIAFVVVGGLSLLFIFVVIGMQSSKNSRHRHTQIPQTGLASIHNAGYTQGGITTRVEQTVPYLLKERHYESNWQEMLLEPISAEKLNTAGFGYTNVLMDKRNVGALEGPQTAERVTLIVFARHESHYYFMVTQNKSAE